MSTTDVLENMQGMLILIVQALNIYRIGSI